MADEFVTPETHIHRDWRTTPIVIPPDHDGRTRKCNICQQQVPGVLYKRATRYISVLEDRYGLERWQERGVAIGLARKQHLHVAAAAAGDVQTGKRELDKICSEAKEVAGLNDKRELGSALHALTEKIDSGEDPPIPPSVKADVDAYLRTMTALEILDIELFVVNDDLKVGGTLDRLVRYQGQLYIADIKSGSLDYSQGKTAMQLAMYARSKRYNPATGERQPLEGVDLSRGIVIHLPPGEGTCQLRWADLDVGWQGIEVAQMVWGWRDVEGGALDASVPGPSLASLIEIAGDVESLSNLWEANQHLWNDHMTDLAAARKAELLEAT